MNESETRRFQQLYERFEAGERSAALQELRELAGSVRDLLDQAALLYHEALFLVEMDETHAARDRLETLKNALRSVPEPKDSYQDGLANNLAVMVAYTELRVLLKERQEQQALQIIEELKSKYPKQLSIQSFQQVLDDINLHHGFLLANTGRWKEARPLLEAANAPEAWRSVRSYYLGHSYYNAHEYLPAERKLIEALDKGLAPKWEPRAHYILGLTEYNLGKVEAARHQFQLCAKTGDPEYLGTTKIWEWLEATSQDAGSSKAN